MKKLYILFVLCVLAFTAKAQLKYTSAGKLTFGNIQPYNSYVTRWEGLGHYYHYRSSTSGNTWLKIYLGTNAPRLSGSEGYIRFYDTESSVYNNIYVKNVYTGFDLRLKTNVASLSSSTAKVLALRPVTYSFAKTGKEEKLSQREIGFIAQEVEKVLPEAVVTDDDGNKLVNYTTVIPIFTGAIQELNARIAALQAKLSAIK